VSGLDWLTARPIAHRGLHDAAAGVIENTASAFDLAIAGHYGIETDVQISRDGEAMVHHDDALGRLTNGNGRLADLNASELKAVSFKATSDRMLTLGELCQRVAGRAALVIELKSHDDGDLRLAHRCAQVLAGHAGRAAVMSFDPALIESLRTIAPALPRGIVAEHAPLYFLRARPHFIACSVKNLPAAAPFIARKILGLPLLTWTVRSDEDRRQAARWADQMIFEGIRP
jgi:glycerophosphoryl diester phosphodiesterase